MTPRAVILTRLIAIRLLWYAGIGVSALAALVLQTPFSVAVVLSAIAIYIPLSMLSLPVMAWLSVGMAGRTLSASAPRPQAHSPSQALLAGDARAWRNGRLPSAWPAVLAAMLGAALLASYRLLADPDLAQCGVLLLLVAADLWLARREAAQYFQLALTHRG